MLVSISPLQERAWRHAPICLESIRLFSSIGGEVLFGLDLIVFVVSSGYVFGCFV